MPDSTPFEPGLFDLFDKHIAAIEQGTMKTDTVLKKDDSITDFCWNVFAQLLEHEFGYSMVSIDEHAKEQATRLRIGLGEEEAKEPLAKLVRSFEELCELWDDVLGFGYAASTGEFQAFHQKYVPRLLKRMQVYASEGGHTELEKRVAEAIKKYESVKGKL